MSNTAIKKNVKGWDKTREIYTTWVSNSVLASFFLKIVHTKVSQFGG